MKKNEKLQNAIGMIGDDLIEEAHRAPKRIFSRRKKWVAAIAACLALSMLAGAAKWLFPGADVPQKFAPYALAYAAYPEDEKAPRLENYKNQNDYFEAVGIWNDSQYEKIKSFCETGININEFTANTAPEILAGKRGENALYSPLNIYILLAMLTEITGGDSREQILALLGEESAESLRQKASTLWGAAYKDNGIAKTLLSSSVWLSGNAEYDKKTLGNLAKYYYASAFSGEMGSAEYNAALQNWLNDGTGGLLSDQIGDIELTPDMLMALAATVYFSAPWDMAFDKSKTETKIFNSPGGEIECEFMKDSYYANYYHSENFGAVSKNFESGGSMCFILPSEGLTPEELLCKADFRQFLIGVDSANSKLMHVTLSVPKFDVSSQTDLSNKLKKLGVTDIFSDATADFTPITKTPVFVGGVTHGVRVRIDEKSCEAASYGIITIVPTSAPLVEKIDLVLDRPFIFIVRSEGGIPLFIGIVNTP